MNPIPSFAQSSVDPTTVSLTITSLGKAVAELIVLGGVMGLVDPAIAGNDWSSFVQALVTAVPMGFAIYHSGEAVWGIIRKIAVRVFSPAKTV